MTTNQKSNTKLYNDFPVNHAVVEDSRFRALSTSAKVLYFIYCKHQNRFGMRPGWFWRTTEQLGQDCGLSIGTVKKAKKELLSSRLIECRRGPYRTEKQRSPNWYRVLRLNEIIEKGDVSCVTNSI